MPYNDEENYVEWFQDLKELLPSPGLQELSEKTLAWIESKISAVCIEKTLSTSINYDTTAWSWASNTYDVSLNTIKGTTNRLLSNTNTEMVILSQGRYSIDFSCSPEYSNNLSRVAIFVEHTTADWLTVTNIWGAEIWRFWSQLMTDVLSSSPVNFWLKYFLKKWEKIKLKITVTSSTAFPTTARVTLPSTLRRSPKLSLVKLI